MKTIDFLMKKPMILIVDDDRISQSVLVSFLSSDYSIMVAGSGICALQVAKENHNIDLILLDISMPDMSGYDVFQELKKDNLTHDIPVIFITAETKNEFESKALQLGAVDYITKPINPTITLLRIKNQILLSNVSKKLRLTSKVFENSMESIIITDANNRIIDVNNAFTFITGYSKEEALNKNPRFLQSGHQDKEFYSAMWRTLLNEENWTGEILHRKKTGELVVFLTNISVIKNARGQITNFIAVSNDISTLKNYEKELEKLAYYDALTGIPNRTLLLDRLNQQLLVCKREHKMLAVCYLDLDGFKPVNDNFGHQAGDFILIEVTKRFSNVIRDCDTVARMGGDEFVILLNTLDDIRECNLILERIHHTVTQPFFIEKEKVVLSVSIGVSVYPDDDDPDMLIRHADQAMYISKNTGKNCYYFYDSLVDQENQQYRNRIGRIHQAFQQHEFELYYQPKVCLQTNDIIGAEALIRWNHPEKGLLFPPDFLNDILNTEFEIQLGEWVIETALKQLTDWHNNGLPIHIAVNISPLHLESNLFTEFLTKKLENYPILSTGFFQIEILETAALSDFNGLSKTILECQKLGVHFALDNFGTGYSSLSHLRNLPIDTLKIDRSFVLEMLENNNDNTIVKGIIALGEAFGREIVAEGVETMVHFELLKKMGCNIAQGYAVGRPMKATDFFTFRLS
jgi:diguanylate cyclase (GGDEF)-like protein/PAS domain S-box-containing protein